MNTRRETVKRAPSRAVLALLAPPAPAQQPAEPPRGGRQAGATAESEANADGAGGGPQVEARGSEPLTEAGDDPAEEGEGAGEKKRRRVEPVETANLEDPVFPTPRIRDAFRIRLQSRFLPAGSFDSFDVDLYRPELRLRGTARLSRPGGAPAHGTTQHERL